MFRPRLAIIVTRIRVKCMCTMGRTFETPPEDSLYNLSQRRIRVAILGAPNVGKSTLINRIIGHPILCVSKKAHTTRERARAAVVRNDTQVVFVDTPGLVHKRKLKKHKLDQTFVEDALKAVSEANIVGIIHDVSNRYSRMGLDPNIVQLLNQIGKKPAFLVLNKVDAVHSKHDLLEVVKRLTNPPKKSDNTSEDKVDYFLQKKPVEHYWTNFKEVFLLSALNGDGVNDLLDYLIKEAKEGKWTLETVSDRPQHKIIKELVRGRLLDELPKEVPYQLQIETEYFHENDLGELIVVVLVTSPNERYTRMLLSKKGKTVRKVAGLAEEDARSALRTNVRLRIVVVGKEQKKREEKSMAN